MLIYVVYLLGIFSPVFILVFAFTSHKILEKLGIYGILNTIISLSISILIFYGMINLITYEKRIEKQEKSRASHDVEYYVKEYKIKEHHAEHKQCLDEYEKSNQTFRDFDIFSCVERKVMIKTKEEQVKKEKEKLIQLKQ